MYEVRFENSAPLARRAAVVSGGAYVRGTRYDLDYGAPEAREMRSISGGGGRSRTGGWFERGWIRKAE